MKAKDIITGGRYYAKVSDATVIVKVVREIEIRRGKSYGTGWLVQNEKTGRTITVKSAQRFRSPVAETRNPARDSKREADLQTAASDLGIELDGGWKPVAKADDVPNPIIATRKASDGGTAQLRRDGKVDAVDGGIYSVSPGFGSYEELEAWIASEPSGREIVSVGWDGGSKPMLRYRDELDLPDSQRSMLSAPDRAAYDRAYELRRLEGVELLRRLRERGAIASENLLGEPEGGTVERAESTVAPSVFEGDYEELVSLERQGRAEIAFAKALSIRKVLAYDTLAPTWLRQYADTVVELTRPEGS